MSTRVGILHPGQMGATVGASAHAGGSRVLWCSTNRSDATRARAEAAGLVEVDSLEELTGGVDVLISVCPPDAAVAVAREVGGLGFDGVYVDANAVAPTTARTVSGLVERGGARFVDGGLIGPPARTMGTTRLYLSGPESRTVADLFSGSLLEAVVMRPDQGSASALKMCYAAWTKGSAALLIAVRALADAEGVDASLMAEWALSQPDLEARSGRVTRSNAPKAWRFAGEMNEIARTFGDTGLPDGFHLASAEVYRRLAGFKDRDPPPELSEAVERLLGGGG